MTLRGQVNDAEATFDDPIFGINLHASEEDLQRGESSNMQNLVRFGRLSSRNGSSAITQSQIAASFAVKGGHKFYYGGASPAKKRLIAYDTKISTISDAGAEVVLDSSQTTNLQTTFTTWSITDKVYIANGTDGLASYDGTTFVNMTGTAIPGVGGTPATTQVIGVLDRLFAITSVGIERTDPRDPTIWSTNSSWATFRASQSGTFKAHIPHMVHSTEGTPVSGALAMTENSYYFYTGTDFGDDVTLATPSAGEDGSIRYIDDIGAFGPQSVTSVPGIGAFWLTNNRNVFFVPTGQTRGRLVGTRIVNTGGSATTGLESMKITAGEDAWLVYSEPFLLLGFTLESGTFPTCQFWLDLDRFRVSTDVPIWYGPMVGQSLSAVWPENQQGDNAIVGGEGDSSVGVFVYTLRSTNVYSDRVGTADNAIDYVYATYHKSGGAPSREKLVQQIEIEMNTISGTATCDIADLTGTILTNVPVERTFV